ncbi:hypothetical protein BDR06DRAFT_1004593 [Suillus hirtellus]|nr:hypothetical protein BDR06DRAFT_1004593 [Suillus hirtellus]
MVVYNNPHERVNGESTAQENTIDGMVNGLRYSLEILDLTFCNLLRTTSTVLEEIEDGVVQRGSKSPERRSHPDEKEDRRSRHTKHSRSRSPYCSHNDDARDRGKDDHKDRDKYYEPSESLAIDV